MNCIQTPSFSDDIKPAIKPVPQAENFYKIVLFKLDEMVVYCTSVWEGDCMSKPSSHVVLWEETAFTSVLPPVDCNDSARSSIDWRFREIYARKDHQSQPAWRIHRSELFMRLPRGTQSNTDVHLQWSTPTVHSSQSGLSKYLYWRPRMPHSRQFHLVSYTSLPATSFSFRSATSKCKTEMYAHIISTTHETNRRTCYANRVVDGIYILF